MAEQVHATREALLEAGFDLLRELTPAAVVAALRTREIARRAGVSPPTFFHHFRTVDEYAEALVHHVFAPDRAQLRGAVTQALREAQELRLPAEQSIAYHTRDLQRVAEDPDFRVRIGLWALGGPAVEEAHRAFLLHVDEPLVPQAQGLHDVWGREVRPPLDLRSYLALQLAILQGAAMRHLADPAVMTAERYGRAAAALSMVLLRPAGDRRTMDDRLAEMNWYPVAKPPAATPSTRRDATRRALLDAAAELFDEYGYEATSIARIAQAAGVHVATLYDHYESKAHLAMTLFDKEATVAPRPLDDLGPGEQLRKHLERLARFTLTRTDLARVYVAAVATGDQPAGFEDVLRGRTLRLLEAVVPSGGDEPPDHLVDDVLVRVIGAMLRHPGDGPVRAARAALRGLC
jgi:AcrR family transcriptional regulator